VSADEDADQLSATDEAEAIRVATEWLVAVNEDDDDTAVRLSAFSASQLGLVRRSLAGAGGWKATRYRRQYAPDIEQLTFIDEASSRSGKLLVQRSGDTWKVLALLEQDGTTFPRAPERAGSSVQRRSRRRRAE
jgi:hypothetical protein